MMDQKTVLELSLIHISSVSDQAVGAVGTANTYISVFIIMFGVISSGMVEVMSQNIRAGKPGIAYQARHCLLYTSRCV